MINYYVPLIFAIQQTVIQISNIVQMSLYYKEEGMETPIELLEESKNNHHLIDLDLSSRKLKSLSVQSTKILDQKNPFLQNADQQNPNFLKERKSKPKIKQDPILKQQIESQSKQKCIPITKLLTDSVLKATRSKNEQNEENEQQKIKLTKDLKISQKVSRANVHKSQTQISKLVSNLFRKAHNLIYQQFNNDNHIKKVFNQYINSQDSLQSNYAFEEMPLVPKQNSKNKTIFEQVVVYIKPLTCLKMQDVTLNILAPEEKQQDFDVLFVNITIKGTELVIWNTFILRLKCQMFFDDRRPCEVAISTVKQDQQAIIDDRLQIKFEKQQNCQKFINIISSFRNKTLSNSTQRKSPKVLKSPIIQQIAYSEQALEVQEHEEQDLQSQKLEQLKFEQCQSEGYVFENDCRTKELQQEQLPIDFLKGEVPLQQNNKKIQRQQKQQQQQQQQQQQEDLISQLLQEEKIMGETQLTDSRKQYKSCIVKTPHCIQQLRPLEKEISLATPSCQDQSKNLTLLKDYEMYQSLLNDQYIQKQQASQEDLKVQEDKIDCFTNPIPFNCSSAASLASTMLENHSQNAQTCSNLDLSPQ